MNAALGAVKGGVPVVRAARLHGVPRATLQDRLLGKLTHDTKPGPKPYLMSKEGELANFLVDVSKAGYGKTRKQ